MNVRQRPVIVGAGPVGLAAALFLARQGRCPRIVDMRDTPSRHSKALAVNPRTLELLEPTGLTARMLELGLPIREVCFHRDGRIAAKLSLDGIHPRYPFMLALSQATTERLLGAALEAQGCRVERGTRLSECRIRGETVEAVLESADDGAREVVECPWLLAADGAHSSVRAQLGVDFVGSAFAEEWHLADVPLRTALAANRAHVFFLGDGAFVFMLRVIDEARGESGRPPIWRVIGNRPDVLDRLVHAEPVAPPLWTSSFRISHRIDRRMSLQRVYFAGDAAHVHSPIGARGMNLGLEDAWVFSELVRTNRLWAYDQLRRHVDRRVVRRVELLSRIASADNELLRFVRSYVFPRALKVPFVRQRVKATVTGLDHSLPVFAAPRSVGYALRWAEAMRGS